MRLKALTKDCPSCNSMKINNDGEFECLWGNSKIPKLLRDPKGKARKCRLNRGDG